MKSRPWYSQSVLWIASAACWFTALWVSTLMLEQVGKSFWPVLSVGALLTLSAASVRTWQSFRARKRWQAALDVHAEREISQQRLRAKTLP
jgi:hypothetical protein